jgi:PAS domain S-box-containing protein
VIERELTEAEGRARRRKAAEEAAYLARQLSEVQSVAHFGYFEYNLVTGEVRLSNEIYNILDVPPLGSVLSFSQLLSTLPPNLLDFHQGHFKELIERTEFQFEHHFYRKGGNNRWVWACGKRDTDVDGNPVRLWGILQDITDRKKVEEAIQTSEMLLNRSQKFAGMGSFVVDLLDSHLTWSDNMFVIHGLPRDNFCANANEVINRYVHPDDLPRVKSEIAAMIAAKKVHQLEFRIVRPNGEERILRSDGEFDLDSAGNPIRYIGMNLDITEFRRIQEELGQSREQLRTLGHYSNRRRGRALPNCP